MKNTNTNVIACEKQLKTGSKHKKVDLINLGNLEWNDLSTGLHN